MSEQNLLVEEVGLEDKGAGVEEKAKGAKPDFNVVQAEASADGSKRLVKVGAMWKNVSKNGNEFYTLKIGKLRLLVFENRM